MLHPEQRAWHIMIAEEVSDPSQIYLGLTEEAVTAHLARGLESGLQHWRVQSVAILRSQQDKRAPVPGADERAHVASSASGAAWPPPWRTCIGPGSAASSSTGTPSSNRTAVTWSPKTMGSSRSYLMRPEELRFAVMPTVPFATLASWPTARSLFLPPLRP